MRTDRLILFLFFCLLSAFTQAQDLAVQMQGFLKTIEQADAISYKATVRIQYTEGTPQLQAIEYIRTSNSMYYKTAQMELMADKTISVMIYPMSKVVMWGETVKETIRKGEADVFNLDSSFNRPDSVLYTGQKNGVHTYIVYSSKHYISSSEFSFRASDGLLVSAAYYYHSKKGSGIYKSEVTFTEFHINDAVPPVKNWTDVLQYTDRKYQLSSGYSEYKLIPLKETIKP